MSFSKYYKQIYKVSHDNGITWEDYLDASGNKVYRKGDLFQSGLDTCEDVPPVEPIYRTIDSEQFCEGYDLMQMRLLQVSTDGGVTWMTTATTSVLIEANSEHCGYVPPTGDCNFMYYTSTDGNIVTPNNAANIDASIVSNTYTDEQGAMVFATCPTVFGERAFQNCSGFTNVTIPNSVTNIGYAAFYGCTSLTSVTIPNSVTSISNHAFSHCTSLPSVTIPDSVTSIGGNAFYYCSGLTSVTIGNSVASIGDYAFEYCTSLSRLNSNTDGVFNIPNSVTSIGRNAFNNCRSLTSVTIPTSVTSIGYNAFRYCRGLTSVTIPNSVTSIGDGTFERCSGLTSIEIPDSVTRIGNDAFYYCSKLTSVNYNGTIAQWNAISKGSNWKTGVPTSCKVHCTDGDI